MSTIKKSFKGGAVTMRQGGIGPDDYLFRVNLPRRRWTYVYIRHKPEEGGRMAYEEDLAALSVILRDCERMCLGDLQRILSNRTTVTDRVQLSKYHHNSGSMRAMSVSEFLEYANPILEDKNA